MYLYKFFNADNFYNIVNLINGKIWASKISGFNDPFEGNIEFDREEYVRRGAGSIGKCADILEGIRNRNPFFISCFSAFGNEVIEEGVHRVEKEYSEMLDNTLMWAHYAKNFSGFCVKYKVDDSDKRFHEVEYESVPNLTFEELQSLSSDITSNKSIKIFMNRLTHKNKLWNYEKEWRLIIKDNDLNIPGKAFNAPEIDTVYFGMRMDREICKFIVRQFKIIDITKKDIKLKGTYRDENSERLFAVDFTYDDEINNDL